MMIRQHGMTACTGRRSKSNKSKYKYRRVDGKHQMAAEDEMGGSG